MYVCMCVYACICICLYPLRIHMKRIEFFTKEIVFSPPKILREVIKSLLINVILHCGVFYTLMYSVLWCILYYGIFYTMIYSTLWYILYYDVFHTMVIYYIKLMCVFLIKSCLFYYKGFSRL